MAKIPALGKPATSKHSNSELFWVAKSIAEDLVRCPHVNWNNLLNCGHVYGHHL